MLSSMMRRKRASILMLFERRIKLNDFQHITSIVVIILTIIMQVVRVDCGKIYKIKIGKENTKSYL